MSELLIFGIERLNSILPEVMKLWEMHWRETETYREVLGYDPDIQQMLYMDEIGWFLECTARTEITKELVGHIGYIVYKSRHTSKKTATEDYFYLMPKFRAGFNAIRLLRFCVHALQERGCVEIGMSSKITNDIGSLLRRVGFQHVADFYTMNTEQSYVLQQSFPTVAA